MDTESFHLITFKDCVRYHGGPTVLDQTQFINCRFRLDLKPEAACEFFPALELAVPVAGKENSPCTVPVPVAGVVVLMPMRKLAQEHYNKAYELRDRVSRVSLREKYDIMSSYYQDVTGELDKAAQQFELWIHDYPHDPDIHSNLGSIYRSLGEYEKAAALTREELKLHQDGFGYANLAIDYIALNRLDEAKAILDQALTRKLDTPNLSLTEYRLAFLQNNTAVMDQKVASLRGKPEEDWLFSEQSDAEAYYGRLQKAREFTRLAEDSAKRNDAKEVAASYEAGAALREAELGNLAEAGWPAEAGLALFPSGLSARLWAAEAFALAGDVSQAQRLADRLNADFPFGTLIQGSSLPTIRAAIELGHGRAAKAIELLQADSAYELGDGLFPAYVRGEAYLAARDGKAATAEFQKLLAHRGIVLNDPSGALAHLQLGRACAMSGDTTKAKAAYQDFFALWKDAGPDIPILKQAKAEYEKLK